MNLTMEEVIAKTKEHMNTCDNDSEEYAILQKLLACAEICNETIEKLG